MRRSFAESPNSKQSNWHKIAEQQQRGTLANDSRLVSLEAR